MTLGRALRREYGREYPAGFLNRPALRRDHTRPTRTAAHQSAAYNVPCVRKGALPASTGELALG